MNVGVDAIVDESCVALVIIFGAPDGFQKRSEADLALRILFPIRESVENGRYTAESPIFDRLYELWLAQRDAWNVVVDRRIFGRRAVRYCIENRLDEILAGAAASAGARALTDSF